MLVDLSLIKQHLRVLHADEDMLIQAYAEAAERQVISFVDRPVYATAEEIPAEGSDGYDEFAIVVNAQIQVAVMLLVGRLWDGEALEQLEDRPPVEVRSILAPLRVFRAEGEC